MNPYLLLISSVDADTKSMHPHEVYPIKFTPSAIASFIAFTCSRELLATYRSGSFLVNIPNSTSLPKLTR